MASSGTIFLPEGLVIQILTKLPVKSMLRFKCVCKYWYTLIGSPSFISEHYHNKNNHTQLLVHHCTPYTRETAFALFPDESLTTRQNLDYLKMPTDLIDVFGPVYGLFLLRKEACGLALWNPATREFRTLPEFDPNLPQCFIPYCKYFGFGLDLLTNNYKVISIRCFWDAKPDRVVSDATPLVSVVGVYNLATDSWRLLDNDSASMPSNLMSIISSIYLKGTHYWLAILDHNHKLLAFDMGNELFRVIQVPLDCAWGHLSLYNDTIALICEPLESLSVDVWVMESEGCWTKHFSFASSIVQVRQPLGLWKNSELFLIDELSGFVLYNLNTHETRNVRVGGFGYGIKVFKYKESLFSVNVGNNNMERRSLSDIIQDFCAYKGSKNC